MGPLTAPSITTAAVPPIHLRLPYIDDKLLISLQARNKFIELSRLLPQQRGKVDTTVTRVTVDDEGATTISSSKPVISITTVAQWSHAFNNFMAYHSFYHPHLSMGLISYASFVSGKMITFPLNVCLAYDVEFRKRMSRYPDTMRWECPDRDILDFTFLQNPSAPLSSEAHSSQLRSAPRQDVRQVAQRSGTQRADPSTEICKRYNMKVCSSPCANNRKHLCWICNKPHTSIDHYSLAGQDKAQSHNQNSFSPQAKNFQQRRM